VEKFPIEAGHVMMFARAVGDPNPLYYDEEYAKSTQAGGILAPPTFVISDIQFDPDTGLRPKIGQPWHGSGKNPTTPREPTGGGGGSGLHAEEHFEYLRPLRVGDVLTKTTLPGKQWERDGRRGGKLKFSEAVHEYRDQNGELVLIARQVGVRTERAVEESR
jgi:N-terminal half of MaoC dehydratase